MTEDKTQKILNRVRGLVAKAQSTQFEEERAAFMAKADELMETYAIELWMLETKQDSKRIVRRNMDLTWWSSLKNIDHDARNDLYWLWDACVRHCRCVTT